MNKQVVDKWFDLYPKLELIICAGMISLKDCREIIGIDRYMMRDVYLDLLEAQAVYSSGSSSFRATKELKEYVKQRREQRTKGEVVE